MVGLSLHRLLAGFLWLAILLPSPAAWSQEQNPHDQYYTMNKTVQALAHITAQPDNRFFPNFSMDRPVMAVFWDAKNPNDADDDQYSTFVINGLPPAEDWSRIDDFPGVSAPIYRHKKDQPDSAWGLDFENMPDYGQRSLNVQLYPDFAADLLVLVMTQDPQADEGADQSVVKVNAVHNWIWGVFHNKKKARNLLPKSYFTYRENPVGYQGFHINAANFALNRLIDRSLVAYLEAAAAYEGKRATADQDELGALAQEAISALEKYADYHAYKRDVVLKKSEALGDTDSLSLSYERERFEEMAYINNNVAAQYIADFDPSYDDGYYRGVLWNLDRLSRSEDVQLGRDLVDGRGQIGSLVGHANSFLESLPDFSGSSWTAELLEEGNSPSETLVGRVNGDAAESEVKSEIQAELERVGDRLEKAVGDFNDSIDAAVAEFNALDGVPIRIRIDSTGDQATVSTQGGRWAIVNEVPRENWRYWYLPSGDQILGDVHFWSGEGRVRGDTDSAIGSEGVQFEIRYEYVELTYLLAHGPLENRGMIIYENDVSPIELISTDGETYRLSASELADFIREQPAGRVYRSLNMGTDELLTYATRGDASRSHMRVETKGERARYTLSLDEKEMPTILISIE